jgi:large subunit ribosomal protein L16
MGGGKGDIDRYVAVITPGKIIYEITGVTYEVATSAFDRASTKMPFKTKVIQKED